MPMILMQDHNSDKREYSGCADLYSIPLSGSFLVYSPFRGVSALVNRKALERIRERCAGNSAIANETRELRELSEALQGKVSIIPDERNGRIKPAFLGIIPTRACNLSCVYCDFGGAHAADDRMDLRMAAQAVDWIAETAYGNRQKSFEVHFFGGEPFVAGELVEVAVHRARSVAAKMGMAVRFEAATNGVFNDDLARFAGDYFDTIVLSFDGPEETHNRNRPVNASRGSFADVARTARALSRSPVELCFRTCITNENVGEMEQTVRWFAEAFSPSIVNFESLKPTPGSDRAGLGPPDPYDFATNFVRASRTLRKMGVQSVYAAASIDELRHSFCPVGKDTAIISPDGRVSSCYLLKNSWEERGLDMDIGRFSKDGAMDVNIQSIERLRLLVKDKPRCEKCFCRWTCAGGCHVNHSFPGCSDDYNSFCIQTRIITACSVLTELGMEGEVEKLMRDRTAMECLALFPSDCIQDVVERA